MLVIYVSGENKLIKDLKKELHFPMTESEKRYEEEQGALDDPKICGYCLGNYTDRQQQDKDKNQGEKKDECGRHFGRLYRESQYAAAREKLKNRAGAGLRSQPEPAEEDVYLAIRKYERHEAIAEIKANSYLKADFKWQCCKSGIFDKGEISQPHVEMDEASKALFGYAPSGGSAYDQDVL